MGAIAFADLDFLSDPELNVHNMVTKRLLGTNTIIIDTYLAPPVIFDLRSCKDLDFFLDLQVKCTRILKVVPRI